MTDPSKVLVFGSFSEDELRSWLTDKTRTNPQEPQERETLRICPSQTTPVRASGRFDGISDQSAGFPSAAGKRKEEFYGNSATDAVLNVPENGIAYDSNHSQSGNKEVVDGVAFSTLHISDKAADVDGKSITEFPDYGYMKLNGSISSSAVQSDQKAPRMKDHPVSYDQEIFPRGLLNSGNLCFLNATLQALLSCVPFVQFLRGLRNRNITKAGHPTLFAFVEFISEFDFVSGTEIKKKDGTATETGRPFRPIMFDDVLRKFAPDVSSSTSGRTRQEDAQEFLGFMMDQMHDELLKLDGKSFLNGNRSAVVSTSDDDGWETVGPKNKSAVTRTQSFIPSELSSIFGGHLRSVVKAQGNRPSATVQPFLLLHLDISHEAIRTIEDALRFFSAPETLDEYRAPTSGKVRLVSARKSVSIQALPQIMILHLKRFGYGIRGSTKLHKAVYFPPELVLNRDILVSAAVEGRKYELVATVTHHGREASRGHYTADVRNPNGRWLRFDDATVFSVPISKVLHEQAYLLFYRQL